MMCVRHKTVFHNNIINVPSLLCIAPVRGSVNEHKQVLFLTEPSDCKSRRGKKYVDVFCLVTQTHNQMLAQDSIVIKNE